MTSTPNKHSTIPAEQNTDYNRARIAAFSFFYGTSKRWHTIRVVATVTLAVIGPALFLTADWWKTPMAIVGAISAIAARLVFEPLESGQSRLAARIQEQFDTDLFQLPWNRFLCGQTPTPQLVSEGNRRFKGDRATLRDWYPASLDLAYPRDVLACQHTNLVWDFRLRRFFSYILLTALVLWFVLTLVVAVATHTSVADYLLAFFLPALPGYLLATSLVRSHWTVAADKEALADRVHDLTLGPDAPAADLKVVARQLQDCIFRFRVSAPPVPTLLQRLFRTRYEADTADALAEFRRRLLG